MERQEEDISVLRALYFGHHLEPKELKRAKFLLHGLNMGLKGRANK